MDPKAKSIQDALKVINGIFEMPIPRKEKCETLYELARRSTGDIVELGTYHGNGAIALCLGKSPDQLVYTVDDYRPKKGWSGEPYGPEDKVQFFENCNKASVYPVLVEKTFVEAAHVHTTPIGLLFWDAGKDQLQSAMDAWFGKVAAGGIVALHDTYNNIFHANEWMRTMSYAGKVCQYEVMTGGVHVGVKV